MSGEVSGGDTGRITYSASNDGEKIGRQSSGRCPCNAEEMMVVR